MAKTEQTRQVDWFIPIFLTIAALFITTLISCTYYDTVHADSPPYAYSECKRFLENKETPAYVRGRVKAALLDGKLSKWEYHEIETLANPPDNKKWEALNEALKDS